MDAGQSKCYFPSYTTAELKAFLEKAMDPRQRALVEEEVRRRETGESVPFVVPQVA